MLNATELVRPEALWPMVRAWSGRDSGDSTVELGGGFGGRACGDQLYRP